LTCVIKSKAQGSKEFILHAPDQFDMRMQCDRRESFLDLLKLRFAHMKADITLKVFGVPQAGLKEYHVTPNRRSGMEHLPPDEYRLHDEEIKSRDEYERDSQKTKTSSSASSTSSKSSKSEESKKGGDSDSDSSFDFKGPDRKDKAPI
jgi:hypothetical protein